VAGQRKGEDMIVVRVLLGLLKGLIIGGALGFGFTVLTGGSAPGFLQYLLYGSIGALTGFVAGRAVWKQETIWTSVVKAVFGVLVGLGLYWVASRVLGGIPTPAIAEAGIRASYLSNAPWLLGPAIAAAYGIFVEVDDGGASDKEKAEKAKAREAEARTKGQEPPASAPSA
jgi:hypothetical protein